jgi:homoserine dehydrogenase
METERSLPRIAPQAYGVITTKIQVMTHNKKIAAEKWKVLKANFEQKSERD